MQDFVEQKTIKDEICNVSRKFCIKTRNSLWQWWGNYENWITLPDTTAIQMQGGELEIGREQTCWYKKKDAKM